MSIELQLFILTTMAIILATILSFIVLSGILTFLNWYQERRLKIWFDDR